MASCRSRQFGKLLPLECKRSLRVRSQLDPKSFDNSEWECYLRPHALYLDAHMRASALGIHVLVYVSMTSIQASQSDTVVKTSPTYRKIYDSTI